MATHRQFIYVRAPEGVPDAGCFRVDEAPMPSPADGEALVLTHSLSIDPSMRRQMGGGRGRGGSLKHGEAMIGRGAGIVIASRHAHVRVGDPVPGEFGWREHVALDARRLRKLPADLQPLSERRRAASMSILTMSAATSGRPAAVPQKRLARRDQALDEPMAWFRAGRLTFRETLAKGFDAAPDALVDMLSGGNIGKQVVRLAAAAA